MSSTDNIENSAGMSRTHRTRGWSETAPYNPEFYSPYHSPEIGYEMEHMDQYNFAPGDQGGRGVKGAPEISYNLDREVSAVSAMSSRSSLGKIHTPRGPLDEENMGGTAPIGSGFSVPRRSLTPSLNTIRTNGSRYRNDADTEKLVQMRSRMLTDWHIHWYMPTAMVVLLILGIIGAISHHAYFKHLQGMEVSNQLWLQRWSFALAFFTKAMLVGSVVLAYRQRIWYSFRGKAMSIGSIDALWAACEDPSSFYNWEMVKGAKVATLMALASWFIPLAAVFSPAALTTTTELTYNQTTCFDVPTLDFSAESLYNYRSPIFLNDYPGYSLLFYNTTDGQAREGYFDYYDQPSKISRRLTTLSAFRRRSVAADGASIRACDAGWNCTFTINFKGPGYKCQDFATAEDLVAANAPFGFEKMIPQGNMLYFSNVDAGDYVSPQVPSGENGQPLAPPPYPEWLGVFRSEPEIWIGHSFNTSKPLAPSSPFYKNWTFEFDAKIFKCEHYEAEYTAEINYFDAIQVVTVKNRTWLAPLVDTKPIIVGSTVEVGAPENAVYPGRNVELYKKTAAYHALGSLFRKFLFGQIKMDRQDTYPQTRSDISETKLIDQRTSFPFPNLIEEVESFYEDMIFTLMSEPNLIIAANVTLPCVKERYKSLWNYKPGALWSGYTIVIVVTMACVGVGLFSLSENGISSDTLFSRILVTTRNPTLDAVARGACLGADPFPTELKHVKLRFGSLEGDMPNDVLGEEETTTFYGARVGHCTFGTEAETGPIVKGALYAGLRRRRRS